MNPTARVANWINERERIRIRKEAGEVKPWTHDPIFQQYRFCNIRREDDIVTRWIKDNWRCYAAAPNLWFAMCLSRQINWPATLAEIGFPHHWDAARVLAIMRNRAARGDKVYGNAYMLRGNVQAGGDKPLYTVTNMDVLFRAGDKPLPEDTLENYHLRLMRHPGWGSFMAGQAVADLKHTACLAGAKDWWDWAAWGPGSNRGLNRYFGRDIKHVAKQEHFLEELKLVKLAVTPHISVKLCSQDWNNVMCEWDKYERARLGEGRPKNNYPGV